MLKYYNINTFMLLFLVAIFCGNETHQKLVTTMSLMKHVLETHHFLYYKSFRFTVVCPKWSSHSHSVIFSYIAIVYMVMVASTNKCLILTVIKMLSNLAIGDP